MTATGPLHFAWVDADETTFGPQHQIWDEALIDFVLEHEEAEFPRLTVTFRNPREGVLAAGRKIWAWLSWNTTPLFFGRIIAMPDNILGERITYTLRARPRDYEATYAALSNSLRVLPFYDPIFVKEERRSDPASAWEGYSKSVHIDRVDHSVSASDWLVGEDGVVDFTAAMVPYESVNLTVPRSPLKAVTVKGGIPWQQSSSATINIGRRVFTTYNGSSFLSGWPKQGDSLAGGYFVVSSSVVDLFGIDTRKDVNWNFSWHNEQKKHRDGDTMSYNESFSGPAGTFPGSGSTLTSSTKSVIGDPATGTPASTEFHRTALYAAPYVIVTELVLGISALRDMKDNAELRLTADIQPVLVDEDDDDGEEIIELDSVDISKECIHDESDADSDVIAAIEDPGRNQYVTTDRGMDSVRYMAAIARARLVMGTRVAEVEWDCRFEDALALSCRKSARLTHWRIPGGEAVGKIVSYSLRGSGSNEFRGHVKIACSVGLGTAVETAPGVGDVFEDGVVTSDVQVFTGRLVALSSGDVSLGDPILVEGGGALALNSLNAGDLVVRAQTISSAGDQAAAIQAVLPQAQVLSTLTGWNYWSKILEANTRIWYNALVSNQVWFELELVNLEGGGIEARWQIPTSNLVLPRQIDFTAGAS